jgi:hypothetical protein
MTSPQYESQAPSQELQAPRREKQPDSPQNESQTPGQEQQPDSPVENRSQEKSKEAVGHPQTSFEALVKRLKAYLQERPGEEANQLLAELHVVELRLQQQAIYFQQMPNEANYLGARAELNVDDLRFQQQANRFQEMPNEANRPPASQEMPNGENRPPASQAELEEANYRRVRTELSRAELRLQQEANRFRDSPSEENRLRVRQAELAVDDLHLELEAQNPPPPYQQQEQAEPPPYQQQEQAEPPPYQQQEQAEPPPYQPQQEQQEPEPAEPPPGQQPGPKEPQLNDASNDIEARRALALKAAQQRAADRQLDQQQEQQKPEPELAEQQPEPKGPQLNGASNDIEVRRALALNGAQQGRAQQQQEQYQGQGQGQGR